MHSLHCYFLLSASPSFPVLYYVERLRDGKSYATRSVKAVQNGSLVFKLTCSFQKLEPNQPKFQRAMPSVPPPDACILTEDEIAKYLSIPDLSEPLRKLVQENIVERRMSPIAMKETPANRGPDGILTQCFWMRAKSIPRYELPFQKVKDSVMFHLPANVSIVHPLVHV